MGNLPRCHGLEAGFNAMLIKDLEQAALREAVLLAELVRGGAGFVEGDDLGDSGGSEAVIEAAWLHGRCAWLAWWSRFDQPHEGAELVSLQVVREVSKKPGSENPL